MSLDLKSNNHQNNLKEVKPYNSAIYEFEDLRLDAAHLMLSRNGEEISLTPKVVETLLALVERSGEIVSKDELMDRLWANAFVEESNLLQNIYILRKTLGETKGGKPLIETLRRRGYRFNGELKENEQARLPLAKARTDDAPEDVSGFPAGISNKAFAEKLNAVVPSRYRRPLAAFALLASLVGAIALGYYFFSTGKTVVGDKKSIAVLSLKPINTANRDELYEVGIADSLILQISSIKGFIVRPLSATRKYADIEQDPLAAGREQKVDYVLASNYQLAGGKIKVTSQLFNVANGQIEETYKSEKDAGNVFAMQDAIAGEVGNILRARFGSTTNNQTAKRGTTNEEAYRLYLQGRNLSYNRTAAATRKAVEYFEQAIKLDPNFARAYSGMAHAFIASGNLGGGLPREEYEKAREAVKKALELDSNLAEGYEVLGELKFTYEWDFAGAEKDFLRAVELEPNSESAHEQYSFYLATRRHFDEAIAESNTALEINPSSLVIQQRRGVILYLARHYNEAIIQLKRIIEVDANFVTAYGWLRATYEKQGDDAQAYDWFIKSQKQINSEHIELYQNIYKTSGWKGVKQKQFEMEKQNQQKPSANLFATARLCAQLGEKEQAFAYLNKAVEKRQGQMVMLNVEPSFDLLRDDPRFDELVRRVGLK